MSVTQEPDVTLAKMGRRPLKPKRYSIQRRFVLMQEGTIAMGLLLVACALYLRRYPRQFPLLLLVFVLVAILAFGWFRLVHHQHLWKPLENLRQMVLEVRRGNLDVTGEIPESIELGSLVQAFLEMAAEVREVRNSLEEKVKDQTAELEAAQRDLVQAAKLSSLGQLVSGVAHEINNSLTSVLGFSEIVLGQPGLAPSLRAQVQAIRDESLRLKNLAHNLSSVARRDPHQTQHMDVRCVMDRLVELRRYQLTANNIELHFERPPRPIWVNADPDQLLQVLLNLVLNAEQTIKACRERGEIWLRCTAEGARVSISVRDNGSGMSPEVRDHIFDPFFTTRPTGRGTGLGLSISHGIIQQHRGEIGAESELGQGTTLRVTLPAASEEASGPSAVPAPATQAENDVAPPIHALVIDDEPEILNMLSQALGRRAYKTTLLNGTEDLETALDGGDYDLVICDMKMPGITGLDVLRLLRQKRPELAHRFLLMTGNLADTESKEVELAGVPVLQKPFTLSRLREVVGDVAHKQGRP